MEIPLRNEEYLPSEPKTTFEHVEFGSPTEDPFSFESVNAFVHHPMADFEILQGALLSLASKRQKEIGELKQLRHEKEQAESPMFSRRELLQKLAEAEKGRDTARLLYQGALAGLKDATNALHERNRQLADLDEAITAEYRGQPWEVGYTDNDGKPVWKYPVDGIGYYLRNLQSFRLRAVK